MKRLIAVGLLLVGLGLQEQVSAAALSRTGTVATNPGFWTRGGMFMDAGWNNLKYAHKYTRMRMKELLWGPQGFKPKQISLKPEVSTITDPSGRQSITSRTDITHTGFDKGLKERKVPRGYKKGSHLDSSESEVQYYEKEEGSNLPGPQEFYLHRFKNPGNYKGSARTLRSSTQKIPAPNQPEL